MQKIDETELSPIQATSYWWINSIREKVREIVIKGPIDKNEEKFATIFYCYTELDWRNMYLQLTKYISEDVDNYVTKGISYRVDAFNQDTAKDGHDRINDEISKIINQRIPNICLSGRGIKDSVIYTTQTFASVWYKSCGVNKLPTKYESSYVLTGNDDELNFYNLLISTIAILDKEDRNFRSISLLRERFCKEYIKLSDSKERIENVIEKFNKTFNKANDKGLILGRSNKETYFTSFRDIDFVGLDSYMGLAQHYANVVLQKVKDGEKNHYCKKIKKK